jgi:L-ascorbate metabolism protein UlaG (beta-lactamase superfamily)
MNSNKKIIVFASHKHEDHFNPMIFKLAEEYPDIEYVLSSDINLMKKQLQWLADLNIMDKVVTVQPLRQYELKDKQNDSIMLKTLKSTDVGVAFLMQYQGNTIYHAGDLNLWVWKDETKQYNNNMKANFQREVDSLKDLKIDIAFVPLDPRQEENYSLGLEYLLNTANVKYVFPMHFWKNPSVIEKFKSETTITNQTAIIDVCNDGQNWMIEI